VADLISYVGHATVRVEIDGTVLLTDPLLRDRFLHIRRRTDAPAAGILDGLDAVLVSHLHPDHLDFHSIESLDRAVEVLVPSGGAKLLRRHGFARVTELMPGDSTTVGSLEISATPAVHDGRRYPVGRAVEALGYAIRGSSRVYFAGDTDLFDGMTALAGAVDVALLPVGGWGPRVGRGHLDPVRAARAAAMIRPRIVIPIHWGTYRRIGLAPDGLPTDAPRALIASVAELAPDVVVRVLEPGESMRLGLPAEGSTESEFDAR
jgi:L-ascorbate metabolism protein UlaG (beta-lactamase superfamily)